MKFIDMFCGMGTARMAFEQARHKCVYSIEWDKHKRNIYKVVFGSEPEGETCEIPGQVTFQEVIVGLQDFPAKTYPLQESKQDLQENGQVCSSKSCDCCKKLKKKIDPHTCCLKTLRTFYQSMTDETSLKPFIKWMKLGMMQNGVCLTLSISECHKTGNECSLSDILEDEVHEKYFLSVKAMGYIQRGAERGRNRVNIVPV